MKAKPIILTLAVTFGIGAYLTYQYHWLLRFPGDRGAAYDTWETSNKNFKIRMTAYFEEGIYMPGAFYTFETAPIGSNGWRQFKAFRGDDAIPLSDLNGRFHFLSDQTAYFYMADEYIVTTDSGRNWSVWKPYLASFDDRGLYWTITEVNVAPDGNGRALLEAYDEETGKLVSLEAATPDFGRSWKAKTANADN